MYTYNIRVYYVLYCSCNSLKFGKIVLYCIKCMSIVYDSDACSLRLKIKIRNNYCEIRLKLFMPQMLIQIKIFQNQLSHRSMIVCKKSCKNFIFIHPILLDISTESDPRPMFGQNTLESNTETNWSLLSDIPSTDPGNTTLRRSNWLLILSLIGSILSRMGKKKCSFDS